MELLKNLEGLSADEQMSAVVELQKAAMKHLEEQKQASIGKSAEMVILGLKKIKSDFEAKFDSLNYDIQTKVANLKDGQQGLQGPKGEQGDRGLDGYQGKDGRDGKDGKDGTDGVDGVGVQDAKIDFDGSLVITLSDGREINVGEVVPVDVAQTIHKIQSGSGGDSQTTLNAIAALQATIATYGTMATQNANNVAITGGTINNTTIGATTPAAGTFTTLTGNSTSQFGRSSANYLQAVGAASSSSPIFSVAGSDTNIDLNLTTKGTGAVNLNTGNGNVLRVADSGGTVVAGLAVFGGTSAQNTVYVTPYGSAGTANTVLASKGAGAVIFATNTSNSSTGTTQAAFTHTASAVNYVQVTGAATGSGPTISSQGSDANVRLLLNSKGSSSGIDLLMNNSRQVFIGTNGSAVNYLLMGGTATGFGPRISAEGSDTNIPLVLQPKGTGALQAQQTDSTATGGNARGANAVDWQTVRSVAGNVASGGYSIVGGGNGNTASTSYAATFSGLGNSAIGVVSVIAGGQGNISNGNYSALVGGVSNTSSGWFNFVGGGYQNSTTANAAVTTQSATMNGTTAVTLSGSNASIKVGQIITGTSIAGDTYVAAVSGTSLTLSKVASGSSTSTLSFYTPHGVVVGGGNNTATGSYSFIGGGGDAGTAANRNVASGDWSVVGGGRKNVASGIGSVVAGGGTDGTYIFSNTASGTLSTISGGWNHNAGVLASVVGGQSNNASGYCSTVVGSDCVANGSYSTVIGGVYGFARGIEGNIVFVSSVPITSGAGKSQTALLVLGAQTTDATATVLRSNTSAAGTTNQVILPNNSAYAFRGTVIANVTGAANGAAWSIEGAIMRGANAASTVLIDTPSVNRVAASSGASAWVVAVTADTTNGGLAVTVTGAASTTIRWVCKAETTEVTF